MFRLIGLAISIGLADSLNPTTIGPALYLAMAPRGRRQVLLFTAGVFSVYMLGGVIIALGPGQLLLSLLPHPHRQARWIIEIAVGAALICASLLLWENRRQLARREAPAIPTGGRSSLLLGASITVVELPTAFPYFAVIAAVVGSGFGPPRQVVLLLVFNVFFVLPLLGIALTMTLAGTRSRQLLERGRLFLDRRWPHVLATMLGLAGVIVLWLGVTGLTEHAHGGVGRLARHIRDVVKP